MVNLSKCKSSKFSIRNHNNQRGIDFSVKILFLFADFRKDEKRMKRVILPKNVGHKFDLVATDLCLCQNRYFKVVDAIYFFLFDTLEAFRRDGGYEK